MRWFENGLIQCVGRDDDVTAVAVFMAKDNSRIEMEHETNKFDNSMTHNDSRKTHFVNANVIVESIYYILK